MDGQRTAIYVIEDEYFPLPKSYRYRFKVISEDSPYFGLVDFIYSNPSIILSAGHSYDVRVNTRDENPQIVEVFSELPRSVAA